jgi:hypothetical protein
MQVGAYVSTLDAEFTRVQRETSTLIKREKEQSDAMFQFGLALTLLAQSEVRRKANPYTTYIYISWGYKQPVTHP